MNLTGRSVVLGVTGGIACYKSVEVVSRLKKLGADVHVVMTEHATKFIAPLTFESISGNPVVWDTFARPETWEVEHIALAKRAEVFLVAPATANIMAKLTHGIADDMLSTTLLATKGKILLAPAMNTGMWTAAATQDNLSTLLRRGMLVVGPEAGMLACGDVGAGRMSEPEKIVSAVEQLLTSKDFSADLAGVRVLVTAGATKERLDPVRYMTNDSSGKMGMAIASAAQRRGAHVTLVKGAVTVPAPAGVEVISIESTMDLYRVMMEKSPLYDVIIQAAAPADYRFSSISSQKMKKQGGESLTLELIENPDVAKAVGEKRIPGQVLVGFAAETQNLVMHAREKLVKKHLDLLVANDVTQPGAGFYVDTNIATLIWADGERSLPLMTKSALAEQILDEVVRLRHTKILV